MKTAQEYRTENAVRIAESAGRWIIALGSSLDARFMQTASQG